MKEIKNDFLTYFPTGNRIPVRVTAGDIELYNISSCYYLNKKITNYEMDLQFFRLVETINKYEAFRAERNENCSCDTKNFEFNEIYET